MNNKNLEMKKALINKIVEEGYTDIEEIPTIEEIEKMTIEEALDFVVAESCNIQSINKVFNLVDYKEYDYKTSSFSYNRGGFNRNRTLFYTEFAEGAKTVINIYYTDLGDCIKFILYEC